jgi:SPASM domain peptide maturase of grasp-with-spasm system
MNKYFHLFSCCIPVKGYRKAVICDLQRNIIQPIPMPLYEMLVEDDAQETKTVEEITLQYGLRDKQLVEEYLTFLYHNQFGYTTDSPVSDLHLDMDDKSEEDRSITNAIVDYDACSQHSLESIVPQLDALKCLALEIRFYYLVSREKLDKELGCLLGSSIKTVEIVLEFGPDFTLEKILDLKDTYPILRKITVSNSCENTVYHREELTIIYTHDVIRDEKCCGVTNEFYCIAETKLFIESVHFNSCLNKKIAVDKKGFIRNCPSMSNHYGHISVKSLLESVQNEDFRKIWTISKDQIEVCSDCELRYVCQDCRAYIADEKNIYSKPVKCKYNPYE